jgi:hypothetical protein
MDGRGRAAQGGFLAGKELLGELGVLIWVGVDLAGF